MAEFNVTFQESSQVLNTTFQAFQMGGGGGTIPVATRNSLGGVKVGANLTIDANGVLAVDVATEVEQDNTRPVTSGAVSRDIGNIEALLAAL